MVHCDDTLPAAYEGMLKSIFQFTYVARPRMQPENIQNACRQSSYFTGKESVELIQEMVDQKREAVKSLSEGK